MVSINGHHFDTDNKIAQRRAIHGYGTVVRTYRSEKPALTMCGGCRDDYYNHGGRSSTGRCWGIDTAKVVDKVGYSSLNACGGVDTIMKKTLSCWHAVVR